MVNNKEIEDNLFEYIQKLSEGIRSKDQFEKYREYLILCNPSVVNSVLDRYINIENDFDYQERIVAQFIRSCERGLDAYESKEIDIPYISLLLQEDLLIEKHNFLVGKLYKDLISDYKKSNQIDSKLFLEFKNRFSEYDQLKAHYLKLQNSVFPLLEKYNSNMNCLKLMWHIQDSILKESKILIKIIDKEPFNFNEFNKVYGDMFSKIGKLIYREKKILFPLAASIVDKKEFQKLFLDVTELGLSFDVDIKDFNGGNSMSENINNNKERKDELNKIIKALNNAENDSSIKKKIKKDFKRLLDTLSPEEIAEAEQALIAEGVAVEEVQKLCELHVDTFNEALKKASKREIGGSEKISGHPIANYKEENKTLKSKISNFKKAYKKLKISKKFENFDIALQDLYLINIHYTRKENQLFPYLEDVDFSGPSKVMWSKHDEIRAIFKSIKIASENKNLQECVSLSKSLIPKLKKMVFMEEKILFPTALRKLPESVWAEIRKGEGEIGYSWIKPGNLWAPEVTNHSTVKPISTNNEQSLIDLSVGSLSASQINLMLTNLPIDITFVDENDKVRYFSQGKERIFPRSPGIIGRDVQNCHPPKSVHIVQKIVDDFKSGKRDVAEFWIQMNGSFIHIRYFPLFEKNVYKGVIEVSQEISSIRSLEGEKRLLDEE